MEISRGKSIFQKLRIPAPIAGTVKHRVGVVEDVLWPHCVKQIPTAVASPAQRLPSIFLSFLSVWEGCPLRCLSLCCASSIHFRFVFLPFGGFGDTSPYTVIRFLILTRL